MLRVWRCISECLCCSTSKTKSKSLQIDLNQETKNLENEEKGHEEKGSREILYLPVITVDDLAVHRKKRSALSLPHDNLEVPSGSFKHLKSEYTRRFKGFQVFLPQLKVLYAQKPQIPQPSLKLEGQQEYESEYDKSFGHKLLSSTSFGQRSTDIVQKDRNIQSQGSYRPKILRRCASLKLEGDLCHITSYAEDFIRYIIEKRERFKRRETNLKLTGDMEHETEFSRNFVAYKNFVRPPLCKKFTNLHLSGLLNLETENRNNYMPQKVEKHTPFVKKPTNLHLEGTLFLEPEYKSAYIEYEHYEKQKPTLPVNHFTAPLVFADNQPNKRNFGSFTKSQLHPVIPFLRESYESSRPGSRAGSRESSRPCSRSGSRPGSRDYSPQRSLPRNPQKGHHLRRGSADSIGRGPLMSVSRSPTMPNLRDKPTRLQPLSMSMREPPKIRITDEDDRRFVRKDQRITYTKKLQPNLAAGLPPLPVDRGKKTPGIDGKSSKRNKWQSAPQNLNQTSLSPSKSPDMEAAFDGRFECQPEYRRAYHNYLMRESKTRSLDRKFGKIDKMSSEFSDTSEHSPNNNEMSSPTHSKPPTPNTKIKKNIEKMETLAFGPRCRKNSFSSYHSSSDGEIIAPKSKFDEEEKKRSPKFHYKHMTIDLHPNMYNSDSEPSFVVVDNQF